MFYTVREGRLFSSIQPLATLRPLLALRSELLPPTISQLHASLSAWGAIGLSPGLITPDRIWGSLAGESALAFFFDPGCSPQPLGHLGMAQELAAWLVLLDKWMETFVVIARARSIWSVQELAGALTFTSRPFLPAAIVHMPPDNWERVAQALAQAVGDGPLRGSGHLEKHWN
ncbi:MAG: hypothetical protein KGS73_00325 [Chloroflexi bacterium]|nr:hypothetical protein [Chloroflexota bacterium]